MDTIAVFQYGKDAGGAAAAAFRPEDNIEVVVKSWDKGNNERVFKLAVDLRNSFDLHQADLATIATLRSQLDEAQRKLPPKVPARLMGAGCVRFDDRGALWMLNRKTDPKTGAALPSKGFGEFGIRFDGGWDDLFRCYGVRVTEHGTDEHGAYWIVENMR